MFRHGRAQQRSADLDDFSRALTKKGIRSLKKSMPELKNRIENDQNLHLWTSPKLRAVQTAEIIAKAFCIADLCAYEFIGSGSDTGLIAELVKMEPPFCVIIVGHEPDLGDWSQTICGTRIHFKKGGAACFGLADAGRLQGDLKWVFAP